VSRIEALHRSLTPSSWVKRFASKISLTGSVLDVACGAGRHTRLFLEQGHSVTAVDRDLSALGDVRNERLTRIELDLETGPSWPLFGERFSGVIVTNYLHRPRLKDLVENVESSGYLIYETFAQGNQRFGKPTNPEFLLRSGELLELVRGVLTVVSYEDIIVTKPKPAKIQRICALREHT